MRGERLLDFSSWSSAPAWMSSSTRLDAVRPESWDLPPRLVHVPSGKALRVVDLAAGTVTTVFEAPEPIVSVAVPTLWRQSFGQSTKERPILIMTAKTIYRLDHDYSLMGTFTIPPELDQRRMITWYETKDGRAIVECEMKRQDGKASTRDVGRPTLLKIAQDGTIHDSLPLSLQTGSTAPSERRRLRLRLSACQCPLRFLRVDWAWRSPTPITVSGQRLSLCCSYPGPCWQACWALSIVLAVIAWRWARAFGLSPRERIVWAGFVLLFGVPAFAGFWLHRPWPVRLPCPHCQARSARDRDTCAECGDAFPAAALKGNEIFA